jgi:hypothetical protein
VEKESLISYKLQLGSMFICEGLEILTLFQFAGRDWIIVASIALKALFIVLFLAGILEVRSMLRNMDGEKNIDGGNEQSGNNL